MINLVARALERPLAVADPMQPLDAIVVLGAPLGPGDSLTAPLAERVRAAAELYAAGGAPIVVTTGGVTRGASRAEADVLADALRAAGVMEVIVERASLTTAENARFTATLLAPLGARRVWLVTQPFHGRRAARMFRAAPLASSRTSGTSRTRCSTPSAAAPCAGWVREYAAWAKLLLRGD